MYCLQHPQHNDPLYNLKSANFPKGKFFPQNQKIHKNCTFSLKTTRKLSVPTKNLRENTTDSPTKVFNQQKNCILKKKLFLMCKVPFSTNSQVKNNQLHLLLSLGLGQCRVWKEQEGKIAKMLHEGIGCKGYLLRTVWPQRTVTRKIEIKMEKENGGESLIQALWWCLPIEMVCLTEESTGLYAFSRAIPVNGLTGRRPIELTSTSPRYIYNNGIKVI